MTSKEALKIVEYDLMEDKPIFSNEEHKEAYNFIKYRLEVLDILTKYKTRTYDYPEGGDYFALQLHRFEFEEEGMKFKEWLENGR